MEAVRDVRQLLELGQDLGAKVNPASTDAVQELLVSLRDTLQQAERAVDGVREFTSAAGVIRPRTDSPRSRSYWPTSC